MRLADARKAALKALAEVRHGGDPVAERKAVIEARAEAAARTTVAELVDLHEAEQLGRGVASAASAAKMLRRDFVAAVGMGRNPAALSRAELVRLLDRVRDGVPGHDAPRPGSVSTFRARLHGLFETALTRGIVQANPLAGYRQPRASKMERIAQAERRAGRMLTMEEIAALWVASRHRAGVAIVRRLRPDADRHRLPTRRTRRSPPIIDQCRDAGSPWRS